MKTIKPSLPPDALAVNILLPDRQKQVEQLVNALAEFRPTKIVIEGLPQYVIRLGNVRVYDVVVLKIKNVRPIRQWHKHFVAGRALS